MKLEASARLKASAPAKPKLTPKQIAQLQAQAYKLNKRILEALLAL